MSDFRSHDNSPSSSGDFTPRSETPIVSTGNLDPSSAAPAPTHMSTQKSPLSTEIDDASDVSMTEDSDDESDNEIGAPIIMASHSHRASDSPQVSSDIAKKRKFTPEVNLDSPKQSWESEGSGDYKRIRTVESHIPPDKSDLPAEIWHCVFSSTHPRALGRLLQVSKKFRSYLDHSYPPSSPKPSPSEAKVFGAHPQTPDETWRASRRVYFPRMPPPLQGLSELDMWKLACTQRCQFCHRTGGNAPFEVDKWRPGPGENGVIPIWPFAIRSCGACLQSNTIKERDLAFSSIPLIIDLIPALPFIFLTADLNVPSPLTLQNEQPPADIVLTKVFLKSHVEAIKKEMISVQSMGSGTIDEWLKGLEQVGKTKQADAARWQKWEASHGIHSMQTDVRAQIKPPTERTSGPGSKEYQGNAAKQTKSSAFPPNMRLPTPNGNKQSSTSGIFPPNRYDSPFQQAPSSFAPGRQSVPARQERSKEEVAEKKAARRAEIERRSALLQPPISAAVLSHMSSFQAAIQIIQPMDDNQWQVLKPRLESQRADAEQREADRLDQNRIVQTRVEQRDRVDNTTIEGRDIIDNDWDLAQAPVRARIGVYADEIIRDGWDEGSKVSIETTPTFAADVLMYVRKRFYAEVLKDEAAARAAGQQLKIDPPDGPYTQRLTLENMKWVFDTKIKPHTETYRKELFLCNGCEGGMNFKFYGFEGVIQHYAAKHTNTLSMGTVVVHWRAEWPEIPPFNPDPNSAVTGPFNTMQPALAGHSAGLTQMPQPYGFGGYSSSSGPGQPVAPEQQQYAGYQPSPAPFYGHPHFGETYQTAAQIVSISNYQGPQQSFLGSNQQPSGFHPYPGSGYPPQNYEGAYSNTSASSYDPSSHIQVFPVSMADMGGQTYQTAGFQASSGYTSGSYNAAPIPSGIYRSEEYRSRLQDLAKDARELWNLTLNIKEMPGSVRVYTILHHLLKRSRDKFQDDPPLAMIIDGLATNKDMRPVRNINGLDCRACNLEKSASVSHSKARGGAEKKLLSLPQLLNHFQAIHIDGFDSPQYDWTEDLVELPDARKITSLVHAPGVDDIKARLLTDAFPQAFNPPVVDNGHLSDQLPPSQDNHFRYYVQSVQSQPGEVSRDPYDDHLMEQSPQNQSIPVTGHSKVYRNDDNLTAYDGPSSSTFPGRSNRSQTDLVHVHGQNEPQYMQNHGQEGSSHERHHNRRSLRDNGTDHQRFVNKSAQRNEVGYRSDVSLGRMLEERRGLNAFAFHSGPPAPEIVMIETNPDQPPRGDSPSRPVSVTNFPARSQTSSRPISLGGQPEAGELQMKRNSNPASRKVAPSREPETEAQRLLDELQPASATDLYSHPHHIYGDENRRSFRENNRLDGGHLINHGDIAQRKSTGADVHNPVRELESAADPRLQPGYISRPRPHSSFQYGDPRDVDRMLYESQNELAGYRIPSERDGRPDMYSDRPPVSGRFRRYEEVSTARERSPPSGSPVYVKLGPFSGQFREQSPVRRNERQPSSYRARSPATRVERQYERDTRSEYIRVVSPDRRRAPPRYEEQMEYVQVADPQGDYIIRRPVRWEPEPIYVIEDNGFVRESVRNTRAQPTYDEEYDPRNPAPLPPTSNRQSRFQ